jgi:hypothetical protein
MFCRSLAAGAYVIISMPQAPLPFGTFWDRRYSTDIKALIR